MRKFTFLAVLSLIVVLMPGLLAAGGLSPNAKVEQAMHGNHRSEGNKARNEYRHPVGTLEFFGIKDDMSVLEIWPGGGWYTEVLAPVLRENGQLSVAVWDPEIEGQSDYRYEQPLRMKATFEASPDVYGTIKMVYFTPPESASLGEPGSYDMVLTFRNAHGWVGDGTAQQIFNAFSRVLKPGGVLGVVQHRADNGTDPAETAPLGYVSEEAIIALAQAAGLELEASSQVNANPRDTKDYPEGVWTLPPGFELEDQDREKYTAIGESDRMTLKFRKSK